jgi:two-component system KDP operon response regulator KdpE
MTSPRPPRILVVDDEPQIRRFLRASLPQQGYALIEAATGAEAQAQFAREKPDLVILDLGLPDCDGLDVLAHIRAHGLTPVLVLSAREDVAGKVIALEAGADDYVTKPFDMAELVARLKAALRHGIQTAGAEPVFRAGALMLDLVHRKVEVSGQDVKLTPKEYDVLRFLARHAGKVVTHHQVLREVWGPAHAEDVQYLRVLMRQLRRKIEADASNPQLLLTEPGVGYRLIAPG